MLSESLLADAGSIAEEYTSLVYIHNAPCTQWPAFDPLRSIKLLGKLLNVDAS